MNPDAGPATAGAANAPADAAGSPFELITEGDALYEAMLAAIAGARHRVSLECYLFAPDEVGWAFAEALAAKRRDGVRVRVHLDAAGSLFWAANRLGAFLRAKGVELRWFHRWSWRRPWRYNQRNHRKLLVVDGAEGFIGGFNIHRQSSRRYFGARRWRDTHLRIRGDLAGELEALFDAFWENRRHPFRAGSVRGANARLVSNHAQPLRNGIWALYGTLLRHASSRVNVTTPYFVPDRHTQRLLIHTARRGVEVRVLVPRKSDVRLARWAARAAYAALLQGGVRLYEYLPRMLHAKTVTIDGRWACAGTANFDYRSFFINYELVLFARDDALAAQLEHEFERDLEGAEEIRMQTWRRRPWNEQVLELIGWAARRLL